MNNQTTPLKNSSKACTETEEDSEGIPNSPQQNPGIMTPHSEHIHYHVREELSPKRKLIATDLDGSRLGHH